MNDQQVFERVRDIFGDLFDVPQDTITVETSIGTLENWDSLQHLNVVLALEENFSVVFEPEEMEEMRSVSAILTTLRSKMGPHDQS